MKPISLGSQLSVLKNYAAPLATSMQINLEQEPCVSILKEVEWLLTNKSHKADVVKFIADKVESKNYPAPIALMIMMTIGVITRDYELYSATTKTSVVSSAVIPGTQET